MDHSWGLRSEHQGHTMSWLHAHFSKDLAFHGIFDFDPTGGPDAATELRLEHGYVLDKGTLRGLASGRGRTIRNGFFATAVELELVDGDGREYELQGIGRTSFPWQAGPGTIGYNVLAEWRYGDQRGWGEIQDFVGPRQLCKIYSDHAAGKA
jgi:hypothetical protein